MEEMPERELFVERIAALDIGKRELEVCVRLPSDRPGRRRQEIRTYGATTRSLLTLAGWLAEHGVTLS